jgi:hypothetical protein
MKRQKRVTKRERKAVLGQGSAATQGTAHIHCIACGRHIEAGEFSMAPVSATYITCQHGSRFPACVSCSVQAEMLVATHDRTGQAVKVAAAWH